MKSLPSLPVGTIHDPANHRRDERKYGTDEAGTLTQNRMTVTDAFLGGKQYDVMPPNDASHDFAAILAESCCINSDANLERGENDTVDHIGSKTECALLQLVEDLRTAGKGDLPASENFAYVACRKQHQVVQRYHFTSARKRMSTAIASPSGSGTRLHCKGASEIVVKMCKKMMKTDGSVVDFKPADLEAAEKAIIAMASTGLRTLCIAYVDLKTDPSALPEEPPEENFTLLGIVGIKDPIRPETAEAVRLLRGAGVVVRMVTGDNALTAQAIVVIIGGEHSVRLGHTVSVTSGTVANSTEDFVLLLPHFHELVGDFNRD